MYIYHYQEQDYDSWLQVKALPDFKNVSFPKEELLTDELLEGFGITRTPVTPPPETLDMVKANKRVEIKESWNSADESNVNVSGLGVFECDSLSRNRITCAISTLATDTTEREWTLANGNTIVVTKAQLQSVINTWMVRCDEYHDKYELLIEQINNATTIEEVKAIKW